MSALDVRRGIICVRLTHAASNVELESFKTGLSVHHVILGVLFVLDQTLMSVQHVRLGSISVWPIHAVMCVQMGSTSWDKVVLTVTVNVLLVREQHHLNVFHAI